jgi:DNA-binding NtrC family response regulator
MTGRILIIDDEENVRRVTRLTLEAVRLNIIVRHRPSA